MQGVNKLLYLVINVLWALSIIISFSIGIIRIKSEIFLVSAIISIAIGLFQLFGAFQLWKGKLIIPVICTTFLLLNIDLEGFKYITSTLCYFLFEINTTGATINGTILGDPTILINLSFSPINFNSVSVNILALVQIGLLLYEYDMPKEPG